MPHRNPHIFFSHLVNQYGRNFRPRLDRTICVESNEGAWCFKNLQKLLTAAIQKWWQIEALTHFFCGKRNQNSCLAAPR